MEDENVDLDELIAKKEKRRQKRLARMSGESDSGDEKRTLLGRRRREESTVDESLSKKRGRPKKAEPEVNKTKKKKINVLPETNVFIL